MTLTQTDPIESVALSSIPIVEDPLVQNTLQGAAAQVQDLSAWGLFINADFFVKSIMILLILGSLWSWTIIFTKIFQLRFLNREAEHFEKTFWASNALEDLYARLHHLQKKDPLSAVFCAAMQEWRRSLQKNSHKALTLHTSLEQRIDRSMRITLEKEMEYLGKNMGFLASTGSTALLIGLLGTVWGIIHNFQAIAISGNTSLAVVAPGIAEALFATAIGLITAIPAALAFNRLSADIDSYRGRLENFIIELGSIVSRQLEEGL
jgi:biopolymer transport protein TolQ